MFVVKRGNGVVTYVYKKKMSSGANSYAVVSFMYAGLLYAVRTSISLRFISVAGLRPMHIKEKMVLRVNSHTIFSFICARLDLLRVDDCHHFHGFVVGVFDGVGFAALDGADVAWFDAVFGSVVIFENCFAA